MSQPGSGHSSINSDFGSALCLTAPTTNPADFDGGTRALQLTSVLLIHYARQFDPAVYW
jgi:hypothetical protein